MMLSKAIRQSVDWVIKSAQIIASTKIGFLHVEGPKGGADETAQTQRARLFGPYGLRSRPKGDYQVVLVSPRAGSSMACAIGCDSLTAGPQDLDEGETTLFDHAGSRVDLKKDKSIVITSASGAVARLADSGDVYVVPAFGKSVNLGTTASGLLGAVVTKELVNVLVGEIRNHTHAVSGAATGIPVTPITDVNGSPNVKARKF